MWVKGLDAGSLTCGSVLLVDFKYFLESWLWRVLGMFWKFHHLRYFFLFSQAPNGTFRFIKVILELSKPGNLFVAPTPILSFLIIGVMSQIHFKKWLGECEM